MPSGSSSSLFVATRRNGRWAAWICERRLIELHLEEAGKESLVGNIYLGRIAHVERGLGAAFVEFGEAQPGFLPLEEVDGSVAEGRAMMVQVTRDAMGAKGARLTGRPALTGALLRLAHGRRDVALSARIHGDAERQRLARETKPLAAEGERLIVRGTAQGAAVAALAGDLGRLRARWQEIEAERSRATSQRCLYREVAVDLRLLRDHGASFREVVYDERRAAEVAQRWSDASGLTIAERIAYRRADRWIPSMSEMEEGVEAALAPTVELASGARLRFEPGGTLTAVDVDTGTNVGGQGDGGDAERTLLRVNLEAAEEIARQVRLRNLGGVIVIDFVDLKLVENRRRVAEELRQAVADDPQPCWVGAMSRLGLIEMTRRRRGASLAHRLTSVCSHCGGVGHVPISLSGVFGSETRP